MSKYLLEIGVEELPYKFITSAETQLKTGFEKFLGVNEIKFDSVRVLTTPRRLAVIIEGLADSQPDSVKEFKGPMKKIAYDDNGNLTKAGEGFANKNGLKPEDLYVEGEYVMAKLEVKGKSTKNLLAENIPNIVLKLQGSHFMRWSDNEEKFSRPIRWLVSLYNNEELKVKIVDIESTKFSHAHRSYNGTIEINNPDEYIEKLKKGYVYADQVERRNKIIETVNKKAAEIGAVTRISDDLLEEVTNICEWPVAVVCNFDEEYLKIPDEVTITVMESHQRYFALFTPDGKLTNKFITIANYIGDDFENIKAGNLRVIKARLDDAVFFVKTDTKKKLEEYVENLKGMTFQKGMGSVYDKTQRLIKLSKQMSETLGIPDADTIRTAYLCKADLATNLVFEFTELQGFIGADYAQISGENDAVSRGIKEHYFPLNAESELASAIEGQIVGIADKLDNICAVFASGKKPTGSSDPLGVRRAALGIIKTIIENGLNLNLSKLIKSTLELLPVNVDCQKDVEEFIIQRLIIFLSDNYNKDILEACLIDNPLENLSDYMKRVKAVAGFDNSMTVENANRIIRILKDSSFDTVNESLFQYDEEKNLYDAIKLIEPSEDYSEYLNRLVTLNSKIDAFFEKVLVMDKDENIKNNRIALLTLLKNHYCQIADFTKISK